MRTKKTQQTKKKQRQKFWLRRRYPRCNILAAMAIFPKLFIYKYLHLQKKHCKCSATYSTYTALDSLRVRVTCFKPTYDTVLFKVLANISKFSVLDNLLYLYKSLADKRLVNNLIRGNLLSFPTYTKGQSMN